MEITIPNLGDIDEVEVIELCVAPGDHVAVEEALLVIESDKASMEIPSPVAGVLQSFTIAIGDMVGEGTVVAVVEADGTDEAPGDATDSPQAGASPAAPVAAPQSAADPAHAEIEVLVPDIGDATGVVVIEVAVAEGDEVAINDLLVVLESDKASMEIAAEHAGTVTRVAVSVDQEVEQGTHIATLAMPDGAIAEIQTPAAATEAAAGEAGPTSPSAPAGPAKTEVPGTAMAEQNTLASAARVYAGPAVRRLARELGVDLSQVKGSGNRNRIVKDDVKAHVKNLLSAPSGAAAGGGGLPMVAEVDYARFGEVELVDLSRIQQRGADNLHRSWVNLPHVTQHDEADVTDLETFRASLKEEASSRGVKITPLSFLVKAVAVALQEHPNFNSSLHSDGKQLVRKKYINIGMAVDTPEGLVVPVVKAADTKSIWQLSAEIAELSENARNRKLGMDDLQGGTFSISSLGALGGTGFTPIVNAPEVAILGVGRLLTKPLWDGEAFQPRRVLPLSLSYDHRVINGADGGRFMLFLTQVLEDIRRLSLL